MTQFVVRRPLPIKGLNTVTPERLLEEGFAINLTNAWYYDGISLRRRLALQWRNAKPSAAIDIAGGFEDVYVGAVPGGLGMIYQETSGTMYSEAPDGTYTQLTPTLQFPSGRVHASSLKNLTIIGNGQDNAMIYDGTSTLRAPTQPPTQPGDVGTAKIGKYFITHRGRCYAVGDPSYPRTVFVSDTITNAGLDYWSQQIGASNELGDFIDISGDLQYPDSITGISTHRGMLVVFCTNHILFYNITEKSGGGITPTLHKAIEGEGCLSHDSIQSVGEEVYFMSPNGFKRLSVSLVQGDSQVNDLSIPINNIVKDAILAGDTVNSSCYSPKYGLYLCSLGNVIYGFQTGFQGWFKWTGLPSLLFGRANGDIVAVNATGTYNLNNVNMHDETTPGVFTPFTMRYTPIPFKAHQTEHKPRWRKIEIIYTSDTTTDSVNVTQYYDLDRATVSTSTISLSPTLQKEDGRYAGKLELPVVGRSELLVFDIEHVSNTDFRLELVECYYVDGSIR